MSKHIAVVGAGVAGLTSALYLSKLKYNVTIFERFSVARPVGSGLMLQPTGLSVLDDLGLLESVLKLGLPINAILGCDAQSGRKVLDVAYRGNRFGLGIHRAALFQVLSDAVRQAGILVKSDNEIVSADHTSRNGVRLITGRNQSLPDMPFDLIIDASGAHSPLRPAGSKPRPFSYGAFWATLQLPPQGFAFNRLEQRYRHANAMVGVMPTGQMTPGGPKMCAFFWSLKRSDVQAVKDKGLSSWKESVLALWPATEPLLEQIKSFSDLVFADYAHLTLRQPYHGRVINIGDSAHITSPQLGQGANMALLDARALAYAATHSETIAGIGPVYAKSRQRHVRFFQIASHILTPFYQSDGFFMPWMRNGLIATLAQVPPMPAILSALISGTLIDPFKSIALQESDWRNIKALRDGAHLSK